MQKLKKFIEILKEHYSPFASPATVLFALLVAGQVLFLSLPYLQGKIIDNLAEHVPLSSSVYLVLAMLAVYIASNVLGYLRERYEYSRIDFDLSKFINTTTFQKLLRFSLGQHINEHSGLRYSILDKGSSSLKQLLSDFIYSLLPFVLQIILATGALFWASPTLGFVVFIVSAVYLLSLIHYNINFYPRMAENRDLWNKQNKRYSEVLRNVKLIKLSAKEEETIKEYRDSFEEAAGKSKGMWIGYTAAAHWRSSLIAVGQAAALVVGVWLVTAGVESPGKIVMLIGWMGSIFGNIGNFGWIQRRIILALGDVEKYHEILSREPAVKDAVGAKELERISGRIEFRNVSFAYPKLAAADDEAGGEGSRGENGEEVSKEILREVSFVIKPGETAAIVGSSGAGKTTVVNLLLRGYDPDMGEILVDGINLRNIRLKSLLKAVGYVPQHVELFDNTLRYNLVFAAENPAAVSEAELDEVARKARIDQFYDRLGEKRFDVLIGENGIKLSGGERQRVGIARALLKKPDVLIFDEATSSLDAENEFLIHEAMREALRGRTGIIIAHRLSTIKDADKIIVMDGGTVVGVGRHEELLESCEPYRKLVERQVVSL